MCLMGCEGVDGGRGLVAAGMTACFRKGRCPKMLYDEEELYEVA